ncbi:Maltose transport system permease protein MalG [Candidatus Thermoflexus japonica]|uniref:Maltose transport system permease protein MalG n=1 Tax=Candidatus Thermoflexus japonica TaxID=2035417 RepID=A0A2H5Y4A3_9CHLR|nr:Maltose transport system permease protein MalG [Candidatus Thermoflexus japonica]
MKGKGFWPSAVEAPAAPARPWPRLQLRALFYRPRGDSPVKRLFIHLALWVACLIAVYPVLRVVTISLRPANKLLTTSLAIIPEDATLANYIELLFGRPGRPTEFYLWIWNSLIITVTTATVGLLLSATAAYAFSRFRFPGRAAGLIFLLSTQMFPAAMLLLPLFIMISRLGLINSYLGLVIAYSVTAVPFSIWMLKGYYDTIPRDLEEAALIDGASRLGVLWHIIRPLSTPALAIAFLFNFMSSWNEYIVARIILNKREMYTWPLGLWTFTEQYTVLWGKFAAASILVAVPVTLLFLYSSRWLISGLTLGGVKE